jgi:hypothetical protein
MKDIPVFAWVCLGGILFMVLGLYLSLFTAWRRKNQHPPTHPSSPDKLLNTLRQPWAREDADWEKLHQQTEKFRKEPPDQPEQ